MSLTFAPVELRVALVTGAARGIGLGIAAWLIAEGWRVVVADIEQERGAKVAAALGERAWFVALDVADEGQVEAAVALVIGLSLTDALLTLVLIARGATEVNPVMAYWLTHGPEVFVGVKYLLTCLPLLILLTIAERDLGVGGTRVRHLFPLFIGAFAMVVGWQIYLMLMRAG